MVPALLLGGIWLLMHRYFSVPMHSPWFFLARYAGVDGRNLMSASATVLPSRPISAKRPIAVLHHGATASANSAMESLTEMFAYTPWRKRSFEVQVNILRYLSPYLNAMVAAASPASTVNVVGGVVFEIRNTAQVCNVGLPAPLYACEQRLWKRHPTIPTILLGLHIFTTALSAAKLLIRPWRRSCAVKAKYFCMIALL